MANPQHLKILRQGVKEWNDWRTKHPDVRPNFSRADLSKATLVELKSRVVYRILASRNSGTRIFGGPISLVRTSSAQISAERSAVGRSSARRYSASRNSAERTFAGRACVLQILDEEF